MSVRAKVCHDSLFLPRFLPRLSGQRDIRPTEDAQLLSNAESTTGGVCRPLLAMASSADRAVNSCDSVTRNLSPVLCPLMSRGIRGSDRPPGSASGRGRPAARRTLEEDQPRLAARGCQRVKKSGHSATFSIAGQ